MINKLNQRRTNVIKNGSKNHSEKNIHDDIRIFEGGDQ